MKHTVDVRRDGVYLDNEKFFLISGDFHYFRTLPGGWRRRMELMKDFGLTAVTTYVAWNVHEPQPGEFCFEGLGDLPLFLQTAQDVGLKIILRCSPYMCAEWDMGGLPAWLLRDRTMCLRSSDKAFMKPLASYFKVLCEKIRPYLWTNGGPIILAGLENEYGSFGNDEEYLRRLADLYTENGIDVPFISANGADPFKYFHGILPEYWNGVDSSANMGGIGELEKLLSYQPDLPPMAGEAWCGNIMFWGKSFTFNHGIEQNAAYLKRALRMGAVVNFYMFCGGTNFGFYSGALKIDKDGGSYLPLMTSYDYDAPISEEGTPREKYFAMRDVLDEFLDKPKREHTPPPYEAQAIPDIRLTEYAPLLAETARLAETSVYRNRTVCMEDLSQNYGFIRYTNHIRYTDPRPRHLRIEGLADRATVYLGGKYIGCHMRDHENEDICFTVPEGGAELTILVENCGRVNYGFDLYDRKGILGAVHVDIEQPGGYYLYNFANNTGFLTETLPLDDLSPVRYTEEKPETDLPYFYRGHFTARAGVDTFLDMGGWCKGAVWINGFNLGRYWSAVGPQRTLYVPGELLREENTIEILELHNPNPTLSVCGMAHAIFEDVVNPDYSLRGFELK